MSRRTDRRRGGVLQAVGTFSAFLLLGILSIGEVFQGLMLGGTAFVVFRAGLVRGVLLRDHRRGLVLAEQGDHGSALDAFIQSEAAWSRRAWLDRWRGPLLASAGRWGFADQARYNQALCMHSLGRSQDAARVLSRVLEQCPDMSMARALSEHIAATSPALDSWDDLV